jgi:hypothetical protein
VVVEAADLVELETAIAAQADSYFLLLLALDAESVPRAELRHFTKMVLASGLIYLCAWGPGCEFVHDWFDEEIVYQEVVTGEREESDLDTLVMTTWHNNQSLEEAAEYFRVVAEPADGYASCDLWLAAAVGHPDWATRLRAALS